MNSTMNYQGCLKHLLKKIKKKKKYVNIYLYISSEIYIYINIYRLEKKLKLLSQIQK